MAESLKQFQERAGLDLNKSLQIRQQQDNQQMLNWFRHKLRIILATLEKQLQIWKTKVEELQSNLKIKQSLNQCLLRINAQLLKQNRRVIKQQQAQKRKYCRKIEDIEQKSKVEKHILISQIQNMKINLIQHSNKQYPLKQKKKLLLKISQSVQCTKLKAREQYLSRTTSIQSQQPSQNPQFYNLQEAESNSNKYLSYSYNNKT